jgi:ribulose kinase
MNSYYIGIDVGTGSARAALVKRDGTCVATSTQDIKTFRDPKDYRIFEQSTTDIWSCISKAIKETLKESGVAKEDIKGIGFDATCSLAVTDFEGNPICVTKGEGLGQEGDRNIVLWADHRAEKEAELINSTGSVVLDYVGGTMSVCFVFLFQTHGFSAIYHAATVGDGGAKNSLAEEPYESRPIFPLPVLRLARLPNLSRH